MVNKNDIIKLNIIDITKDALGVAKDSGIVYFVKDAIVGDTVNAVVTKVDKNVIYAKTIEILEESKYRVKSKCEISNSCGGCQLLNLDCNKQIELKKQNVLMNLNTIGKFSNDDYIYDEFIVMDDPCHFRNKMQVPFCKKDNEIVYGFYAGRTHHIVPFSYCMVGFIGAENILDAIKLALLKFNVSIYDENTKEGVFREVLLRCGNVTNEVSITYILNDKKYKASIEKYKEFDKYVIEKSIELINKNNKYFNDDRLNRKESRQNQKQLSFTTSTININTDNNNVLFGKENIVLRGNGYIVDYIGDYKFQISPESFYQINNELTAKLYDKVVQFSDFNKDETVLDLYCGIGTISLYISQFVNEVIGVDIVGKAIDNANNNKKLNNIKNVKFLNYDLSKINNELRTFLKNITVNTVIVDPPRKGLDRNTIETINDISPEKIVYVSCDPSTLARDLDILCHEFNYNLLKISNVDMFPHTIHVETVAFLKK